MAERKIGEIKQVNGEWCQCIEGRCIDCYFSKARYLCKQFITKKFCTSGIIFKKLEKVGGPYIEHDHSMNKDVVVQDYKLYNQHACYNGHEKILCFGLFDKDGIVTIKSKEPIKSLNCKNSVEIEIKENKEDMEEKKVKLDDLVGLYSSAKITYKEFDKELKALYTKQGEEDKPVLKPFNLEEAKAGKPVCTRDGRKARIICFDSKVIEDRPLLVLIDKGNGKEFCHYYTNNGIEPCNSSFYDLMMLSDLEKKEGWINIYDDMPIYESKEEAELNIATAREYITTIKVELEE